MLRSSRDTHPASGRRAAIRILLALNILLALAATRGTSALARTRRAPAAPYADTTMVVRIVPGFVIRQPDAMARVGQRCRIHPHERLRADTVFVHHGFTGELPGDSGPVRDSFPNANMFARGGCVDYHERQEVVFCHECRKALARWLDRHSRAVAALKDSLRSTPH